MTDLRDRLPLAARSRLRSLVALAALQATLPLDLALVAGSVAAHRVRRRPTATPTATPGPTVARTVMISGGKMTKALQLARSFHRAGHRVVLLETAAYRLTGHRFSRAVAAFHVVPDPHDPGYAEALLDVVRREGVDVWVPVSAPAASVPDADAARLLAEHCQVVHVDAERIRRLDDKASFSELCRELGLPVPASHRITDPQQVVDFDFAADGRTYVLKSIAYDPVRRLDLTPLPRPTRAETAAFVADLPIGPDNPWVMQEWVEGQEYCTHSTVRDGRVTLHCTCESSAFQVNYAALDDPEAERFAETLAAGLGVTGQVSLDLIRRESDGVLVAIECNPRTHSAITLFHRDPGVAAAYLDDPDQDRPTVRPTADARATYWLYHEVWRALRDPAHAGQRLRVVLCGRDAVLDPEDPLPYLALHHLHVPSLLVRALLRGDAWVKVDFNIGKLVAPAGD